MNELSLFNNLFNVFGDDLYSPATKTNYKTLPRVDVMEEKNAYTIQMDMPGKTENDVNIELDKNVLTISSIEKAQTNDEEKNETPAVKYLLRERSTYGFSRQFELPEDVDAENISAKVVNGVLYVTLPRKELSAPRKITITAA